MNATAPKPLATIDLHGMPCSGCGCPAARLVMYPHIHLVIHAYAGYLGHQELCRFPVVRRGRTPGVAS